MSMKLSNTGLIAAAVGVVLLLSFSAVAEDASFVRDPLPTTQIESTPQVDGSRAEYGGNIKVVIVEKISRWRDSQNNPYENAFLNWVADKNIAVADGAVHTQAAIWNSQSYGYGSLTPGNYEAIAFLSVDTAVWTNAYPGGGSYYFNAFYTDAVAIGEPGHPGMNDATGSYSHTMLVEEGTATW